MAHMKTLCRINDGATPDYIDLTSTTTNAGMVYDVEGYDLAVFQFYAQSSTTWSVAVVTVTMSLDGCNYGDFPDGAKYYTGVGVKALLRITGAKRLRVQVTTADAGDAKVVPILRVGVDS